MSVNNSQQNASSSLRHSMRKENIAKGTWNKLNNFQTKGITTPVRPFSALKKKKEKALLLSRVSPSVLKTIRITFFLSDKAMSVSASWGYHGWHTLPVRAVCPPVCYQESDPPGTSWRGYLAAPGQGLWESCISSWNTMVHSASRYTLQHT